MAHSTHNGEHDVIGKAIRDDLSWEDLPKRLKQQIGNSDGWNRCVKEYSIKRRLQWSKSPVRRFNKESDYYESLMSYLRKQQAAFPYHLAEYVCRIMRITPFQYYSDLLYEVMRTDNKICILLARDYFCETNLLLHFFVERPYDSIPNFSAADALRETGIGRNQFIDLMNRARSKLMWKLNRSFIREMLPNEPVHFPLEFDWRACTVNLSVEEYKNLKDSERTVVQRCSREGGALVGHFELGLLRELYKRGLIYFDVPVQPQDRFQVRSLEGFVSNTNRQQEDYMEDLLYSLLVASNEHSPVSELAATLQADLPALRAAVSLALRLGWAHRLLLHPGEAQGEEDRFGFGALLEQEEESEQGQGQDTASPFQSPAGKKAGSEFTTPPRQSESVTRTGTTPPPVSPASPEPGLQLPSPAVGTPLRVVLLVDANLTSFLMMGSFSHGLKQSAVTLFEAGKLGDASLGDLTTELLSAHAMASSLEGELLSFAEHASSLCIAVSALRERQIPPQLQHTDRPLEGLPPQESTPEEPASRSEASAASGEASPVSQEPTPALPVEQQSEAVSPGEQGLRLGLPFEEQEWEEAPRPLASPVKSYVRQVHRGRQWVDVLRCESLEGLLPETVHRLLQREYHLVVCMLPLSPHCLSLAMPPTPASGPALCGPPSLSALSPWMNLLLYARACAGPVSVALKRGQRFRQLPPPLAGCAHALVWTWPFRQQQGSGISADGGGGRVEAASSAEGVEMWDAHVLQAGSLLYALNQMLTHSAVLVQPLSAEESATAAAAASETGSRSSLKVQQEGPRTVTVPLPLSREWAAGAKLDAEGTDAGCKWMDALREQLGLGSSVGLLHIARVKRRVLTERQQDSGGESAGDWTWVPQRIQFGVPLSSQELCSQVCHNCLREGLFEAAGLEALRSTASKQRAHLTSFIAQFRRPLPSHRPSYASPAKSSQPACLIPKLSVLGEPSYVSSDASNSQLTPMAGTRLEFGAGAGSERAADTTSSAAQGASEGPVSLPAVNLVFDGSRLLHFDVSSFVQS